MDRFVLLVSAYLRITDLSYPQFDDPSLYRHFNLVSFDLRGHGVSQTEEMREAFNWKAVAEDIREIFVSFKEALLRQTHLFIASAHIVSQSFAGLAALHLAVACPDLVLSLTMITPPQRDEPFTWSLAFEECRDVGKISYISSYQAMYRALDGDLDSLDEITIAVFEFSAGSLQSPALLDMREEMIALARAKLLDGKVRCCWSVLIIDVDCGTLHGESAEGSVFIDQYWNREANPVSSSCAIREQNPLCRLTIGYRGWLPEPG